MMTVLREKKKKVYSGDEIVNTESSRVNRSHEHALVNSDDDGSKRAQVKRRRVGSDVGNTSHKPRRKKMSEWLDFKKLTGGILLSRNKAGLVLYRGSNYFSREVAEALVEQEKFVRSLQDNEEEACLREGLSALIVPSNWGINLNDGHAKEVKHEVKKLRHKNLVRKLEKKFVFAERKLLKAERDLAKVEECLQPAEQRADLESITGEERFIFRKRGSNMKVFLLIGRQGVFNGTVENMHLHWKYRELVKTFVKAKNLEGLKNVALSLESESGGILVSIDKVSAGYARFVYRGKEYKRSPMLRPKNILTNRKALARSIKLQHEGFIKHTSAMHARAEQLGAETEFMEKIADFRRVKKLLTVSSWETLLPSREQMRTKILLLEKQLEEIEGRKISVFSWMYILRNARTKVDSEREKLRVIETKNFAHDLEFQLRALEKK
ncbi:unnamed protein product [Eruca vesicaria subsp. sativa]|uniref:CRM domain-containing protein n=1 Tax=Eruca vesicaria subsp. sativa TaxID=29727 RepID=A0ABC8M3Y8_ERUVS|nr:unnamed protein product [Eruca vesicaria subsp. sativa]